MNLGTTNIDPKTRQLQEEDFKVLQAKARRAFADGDKTPIEIHHIHPYYMDQMKEAWEKNFTFSTDHMTLFSTEF